MFMFFLVVVFSDVFVVVVVGVFVEICDFFLKRR